MDGEATPMEDEENDTTASSDEFITGVIEGFYNRPWTRSFLSIPPSCYTRINREQRLDLFIKLGKWGLNSYLYAPKVTIETPK